jgi:hypothetical protein
MQRVIFMVPANSVPTIALRRMLETTLTIAEVLNVPLLIRADSSYMQIVEALLAAINSDHPRTAELLEDQLKPKMLEQEAVSNFIILPGFGSRKRVADTLGNIPEQLAKSFAGNLAILHFDK